MKALNETDGFGVQLARSDDESDTVLLRCIDDQGDEIEGVYLDKSAVRQLIRKLVKFL